MSRGLGGAVVDQMLAGADHFAHRTTAGVVVDLFWRRRGLVDEFRVEIEDRRDGAHFVLFPRTGSEAIQAFYHPFAATAGALAAGPSAA